MINPNLNPKSSHEVLFNFKPFRQNPCCEMENAATGKMLSWNQGSFHFFKPCFLGNVSLAGSMRANQEILFPLKICSSWKKQTLSPQQC